MVFLFEVERSKQAILNADNKLCRSESLGCFFSRMDRWNFNIDELQKKKLELMLLWVFMWHLRVTLASKMRMK
jgi:hypothetical protein